MPDDWRDRFRTPDGALNHPDAPNGGAGKGRSVVLKQYDPFAKVPAHDSYAGRRFDYSSALKREQGAVARQFRAIFTKEEIKEFRQNPYSYKNAPLLAKALRIYLEADTTPPEERAKVVHRNLSLITGYALGLGQNTTKALAGDDVPSEEIWKEAPGNALVVAGWTLKAFNELRTVGMECKGFRQWLESDEAAAALSGKDDLNVEAALAEDAAYAGGKTTQINRVRTTGSGRVLISLDTVTLTRSQREAAKVIHGQKLSGTFLQAWRKTTNPKELNELEQIKRLWSLGTPQAQQDARKLAEKVFGNHRKRFWTEVRGVPGLGNAFRDAGMSFSRSTTGAPAYSLPDGTTACMSLEHTIRKADNPTLAVTGENLQFVLVDENSYFLEEIRAKDPFQQ
jgi:hypothetical protein